MIDDIIKFIKDKMNSLVTLDCCTCREYDTLEYVLEFIETKIKE